VGSRYDHDMPPVVLLVGSLAVLGIAAVLTSATTRVNEVRIERVLSAGRVMAGVAILASIAGVVGAGIAAYFLLRG
jgi:hypothetical protein